MKITAIIAAAGLGRRMGGNRPKQYMELCGRPIICHTLDQFQKVSGIHDLIVAVEPGHTTAFREEIIEAYNYPGHWRIVEGGATRQESVANALCTVSPDCDIVLVHDGVRPFVSLEDIETAAMAAASAGACIVAAPLKETIKHVGESDLITQTVNRERLWGAKTPQAFRLAILKDAFASAEADDFVGTDEASLVERMGVKVAVIKGDTRNIKITTPEDLMIAEAMLKTRNPKPEIRDPGNLKPEVQDPRPEKATATRFPRVSDLGFRVPDFRIGIGYDIHRLISDRPLILGGVRIPFEKGLHGHSDGDALLHAIADAILGAAAQGDIGRHFPDTDPQFKNADSAKLLGRVVQLISEKGWCATSIDANIIAERPKMVPYIDVMRRRIASLLELPVDCVSVKARTNEGVDAAGRGEAIAVQAVVLLQCVSV